MPNKPLILVVEDDPGFRELFSETHRQSGYKVHAASTTSTAKEMCAKHTYTLAHIDGDVDEFQDGFTFAEWLKQQAPQTKRLLVSNHSSMILDQQKKLGIADDYLLKTDVIVSDGYLLQRRVSSLLECSNQPKQP